MSATPSAAALRDVLNRDAILQLAGTRFFSRGEDYAAGGQVKSLIEHAGTLTAKVHGTRLYRVKLWIENGELEFSCTCPVGTDGAFCKHCVAVSLVWLGGRVVGQTPSTNAGKPSTTLDEIRDYLDHQDKKALVEMLLEQAVEDEHLRRRLLLQAAQKSPKGPHLAAYRKAIDNAVGAGGFAEDGETYDYAQVIEEAVDGIESLLRKGHATEALELAGHAVEKVESALDFIDDSDGSIDGPLNHLQAIHHEACKVVRPDPEALARLLFAWELKTDHDAFFDAAETYSDVLGKKGLAVYRELAEAEWAKVPVRGPGRAGGTEYGKRFHVMHILETLARMTGDVEAVVAVMSRDLSSAHDYLRIAEAYHKARKHDAALEWAERGMKAFPERPDSRLREFLTDEYQRRGRHDEALTLAWSSFTESPDLKSYQKLGIHAGRAGRWEAWREKALDHLRGILSKAKRNAQADRWSLGFRAGHSELVRIFLWEKRVDDAWREAREGGCTNDLWLELAAKRERDHPVEVLPVYQRQVEHAINRKSNAAYEEAIGLMRKVRALMSRQGRAEDFERYVEMVRAVHKPKRNFINQLNRTRWE
jgi:uncharacterized Zn finger protein